MPSKHYTKTFFAYIKNDPNQQTATATDPKRNTGWHIVPNQDFDNYMYPIDRVETSTWAWMKPVKCKTTIGHGIPITDTAALGGTGNILTFNNTLYTLIYQDKFDHLGLELQGKNDFDFKDMTEGVTYADDGSISKLNILPQLQQSKEKNTPHFDFLIDSKNVYVMYPGNNGYIAEWTVHDADKHCFIKPSPGLHAVCARPKEDYTMKQWICSRFDENDDAWQKKCGNIPYRHPLPNILIKLMPIFTSAKNIMPHYQLIMICNELTVEYETSHKQTPSYWLPNAVIQYDGQMGTKYVSSVNNMPKTQEVENQNWYYRGYTDPDLMTYCAPELKSDQKLKRLNYRKTIRTRENKDNDGKKFNTRETLVNEYITNAEASQIETLEYLDKVKQQ